MVVHYYTPFKRSPCDGQSAYHEERERISQLRFTGAGPTRIGKAIGRDKSVVSRELRRNCV